MKNKKGISETTVVVLIIGLLSLAVLVGVGYTITKGISSAGNKAAVQNWVLLKSSKLGLVQGGSQPPVAMLYSDSIKINTEAQLKTEGNKLIADAMVDCWSAFDKGQSNFIDGKGVNDPFCFPCAKIEFDKSLKDGSHNLIEFNNFLSNEKPLSVVKAQSYHEILEGKYVYEQTIQKDKDMYVFFIATKGKIWDRLMKRLMAPDIFSEISKRAAAGAFIGGAAGSVLPGPGTAAGVVIGVGAGVLEYYVSPITGTGEEYFEPMVLLGTPEKISEYCNLELDKCENCGDGNLEKCDKDECQDLADVTGTSCYWDTEYINECLSTQKPDAEELKSANPIITQEQQLPPQTITEPSASLSVNSQNLASLMESLKAKSIEGRACKCESNCQNYANWIIKYSNEYNVENDPIDPLLILSMMMQESNCVYRGCKYDSGQYSCGLMQVNKNDFTSRNEDPLDAETQVKAGVRHLKGKYNAIKDKTLSCYAHRTKWEKAAHAYNGWLCSNLYYIKAVTARYDQLKQELNKQPEPLLTAQK